jgi:hypothetical protein
MFNFMIASCEREPRIQPDKAVSVPPEKLHDCRAGRIRDLPEIQLDYPRGAAMKDLACTLSIAVANGDADDILLATDAIEAALFIDGMRLKI